MRTLLLSLMALLVSQQALAQEPRCAPRQLMLDSLKSHYGETIVFEGMMDMEGKNTPVIVLASEGTRTWTWLITPNSVLACIYRNGTDFDPPLLLEAPRGEMF